MPGQTHVTDTAYHYDGTFAGFLCCIFESYARREIPADVCPPQQAQLTLYGVRDIATDAARARRVAAGLGRLGPAVRDRIATGFLHSAVPGKDLALLRFARLAFARGPQATQMLGDADAAEAFALERAVLGEAHHYIEFLRFEERGGMLGAVIHPKHCVLPLLRGHFCSRLPDEDFLIFDAVHGAALLRQNRRVQYLAMQRYEPAPDADEADWQALWKRFFRALTIEERRNARAQQTHLPRRFWPDMCEMQPDAPDPAPKHA